MWSPCIPPFILYNIISQLITPKLLTVAESMTSAHAGDVPVHTLILPWVSYLNDAESSQTTLLWDIIRIKLLKLVKRWDVQNTNIHEHVQSWQAVLNRSDVEEILDVAAYKIFKMMEDFVVNPSDQSMGTSVSCDFLKTLVEVKLILSWKSILLHRMTPIVDYFFHKWLHALYIWLSVPHKSASFYGEISKWYAEWRALFPQDFAKEWFTIGLHMMVCLFTR